MFNRATGVQRLQGKALAYSGTGALSIRVATAHGADATGRAGGALAVIAPVALGAKLQALVVEHARAGRALEAERRVHAVVAQRATTYNTSKTESISAQ